MRVNSKRNEEAVSAAVATVLLFGGVVSIIGLMLVSMVPIIEELEGSIERSDMSSQMMILAQQTESLSESGMPGDSTSVELIPIDGNINWDLTRGGMWYSSTWQNESSFRMVSWSRKKSIILDNKEEGNLFNISVFSCNVYWCRCIADPDGSLTIDKLSAATSRIVL